MKKLLTLSLAALVALSTLSTGCASMGDKDKTAKGAGIGGVTGAVMDKQEEDLRKAGIRTERDEAGNLIINLSGETLKFDTGKSALKPEGEALLTRLSSVLKKYHENRIVIEGHTDNIGRASDNRVLSQGRADSVKSYLMKQGVPAKCITASTGYGDEKPIADNKTEAGRAQNRRVELSVTVDETEANANQAEREKYKK